MPTNRAANRTLVARIADSLAARSLPTTVVLCHATERVARLAVALEREIARNHHLGGDAGVVYAHLPQRAMAAHAVVADQRVLQRVLERVAHVQRAGDVGRRQQDAVGGAVALRREYAARFPFGVEAGFEGFRVVAGGERGHRLFLIVIPAEAGIQWLELCRIESPPLTLLRFAKLSSPRGAGEREERLHIVLAYFQPACLVLRPARA